MTAPVDDRTAKPRTFWQQMWEVNLHPRLESFERQLDGHANFWLASLWLFAVAVLGIFFQVLLFYLSVRAPQWRLMVRQIPPEWGRWIIRLLNPHGIRGWVWLGLVMAGSTLAGALAVWLSQLFNTAINHLAAKLLGGDGSFADTFYLITLADLPIWFLMLLLSSLTFLARLSEWGALLSMLASFLSFLVGLYLVYLESLALAAAHRISVGKGVIAALAPLVIGFIVSCLFYTLMAFGLFLSLAPFSS